MRQSLYYQNLKKFLLQSTDKQSLFFRLSHQIASKITSNYILSGLQYETHHSLKNLMANQLFIDFCSFARGYSTIGFETPIHEHTINCKENGIIAMPWKRERLLYMVNYFANEDSSWEMDMNHQLLHLEPFNIYLVISGNHSIGSAILHNKVGYANCSSSFDFTQILKDFDFNGKYFFYRRKRLNNPYMNDLADLFLLGKAFLETTSE